MHFSSKISFKLFLLFVTALSTPIYCSTLPAPLREVDLQNGWLEIFPGGETTCGRGEEFSFFFRQGSSSDIVIDFVGGGACWSYETCHEETALFVDSVDYVKQRLTRQGFQGIYDHHNPQNPLKDWSHVVIPYCTGDLHWGDNVMTYTQADSSVTIFHKGAVNAKTALTWSFARHHPDRIFVTGTSAGGYASIYWLPYIKEQNPAALIIQFSDGAAGVIVKEPYQAALRAWQIETHAPLWIPSLNASVAWSELTIADLYNAIGTHYPTVTLSQFNTFADRVQMFFYRAMGAPDDESWSSKALQSMKLISASLDNFQYFHASGRYHTILADNDFYSVTASDVTLVEWLNGLIDKTSMSDVLCADCEIP